MRTFSRRTVPAIATNVCAGLDPAFANAAALSVLAYVEDLIERGSLETNLF
jgi:hypothetical protein